MLFDEDQRDGIRLGRITVTFRNWQHPPFKSGEAVEALNIGTIDITNIKKMRLRDVSASDARAAGATSLFDFFERFRGKHPGLDLDEAQITRIRFRYKGESEESNSRPRPSQVLVAGKQLEEIDDRSRSEEWTIKYIGPLTEGGTLFSSELADILEEDQERVKKRMGQLKKLEIVESSPKKGYSLTSLGEAVWLFLTTRHGELEEKKPKTKKKPVKTEDS